MAFAPLECQKQAPSIDGIPFVCSATWVQSFIAGRLGRDCRNCQTFAAPPAEPGVSFVLLESCFNASFFRKVVSIPAFAHRR